MGAVNGLLAVAASVVFLARLLPQPLRTLRTGQVAGVSCLAAMNALIADAAWLLYGATAGVLAVWLVSVPALLVSGWTVTLLRRSAGRRDVVAAGVWAGLVVVAASAGQLTGLLSLTVVVCCGPAVWSAFSSPQPAGLSRWTWWLAVADALSWGGYGLAIGDRALQMYGVVLSVTAVTVLLRLRWVRLRSGAGASPLVLGAGGADLGWVGLDPSAAGPH